MKPAKHLTSLGGSSRTSLGLIAISLAISGYTVSNLLPLVTKGEQPKIIALMALSLSTTILAVWKAWRGGGAPTTTRVRLDQHFDGRDCKAFELTISRNRSYIAIDCEAPETRSSLIVQIDDEDALTVSIFDGDSQNVTAEHITLGSGLARNESEQATAPLQKIA